MKSVITDTDLQFTKTSLRLINVQKKIQKIIFRVSTAVNFNSFQQKSINTLNYASMWVQECLSCIGIQYEITISLLTIKKQKQAKTEKNSVEKCAKKVSKQFKP